MAGAVRTGRDGASVGRERREPVPTPDSGEIRRDPAGERGVRDGVLLLRRRTGAVRAGGLGGDARGRGADARALRGAELPGGARLLRDGGALAVEHGDL